MQKFLENLLPFSVFEKNKQLQVLSLVTILKLSTNDIRTTPLHLFRHKCNIINYKLESTTIKVIKKSEDSRNQGYSFYFCLIIEGSGPRSVPLTNRTGSGRSNNLRTRIRNTAGIAICGYNCPRSAVCYTKLLFYILLMYSLLNENRIPPLINNRRWGENFYQKSENQPILPSSVRYRISEERISEQ